MSRFPNGLRDEDPILEREYKRVSYWPRVPIDGLRRKRVMLKTGGEDQFVLTPLGIAVAKSLRMMAEAMTACGMSRWSK